MADDSTGNDKANPPRKLRSLYSKTIWWLETFFVVFWIGISMSLYFNERMMLENEAAQVCQVVLSQIDAAQVYVREELRPVMFGLVGENEFYPQAMSSTYVSKSIFQRFQEVYPDYHFKFASLTPRNPQNAATDVEKEIIAVFRESPDMTQWKGKINFNGELYQCVATPIVFDESCMACHGVPSDAPSALVAQYGNEAGFYLNPGDTAIKWIGVPIGRSITQAKTIAASYTILAGVFFLGLFWLTARLIRNLITKPLDHLQEGAVRIGSGELDFRLNIPSRDEFEELAESFNSMAERINVSHDDLHEQVAERTRELNERLAELEVFNKTMVGRERRMVELKNEINDLYVQLGRAPKFGVNQSDSSSEADID